MTDVIVEIVDQGIAAAQRRLDDDDYDWPASRAVLEIILVGLEARSFGHPDLKRLRRFVALGDEAWEARQGSTNG